jgi:glycosyltransferase involved in cell wall biosynthesis
MRVSDLVWRIQDDVMELIARAYPTYIEEWERKFAPPNLWRKFSITYEMRLRTVIHETIAESLCPGLMQRIRSPSEAESRRALAEYQQDGVDHLLRSLRHLFYDLKRSDFHCIIMGTGDSLQDLRNLAEKLQLSGCVELAGFSSDEDLQSNLAAADICLDPDPSSPLNDVSTWIKIMEYMAYGKPIVAFDLKETRCSAGDAAIYVRPNDQAEFAQAITRLMAQPELRKRMGVYGRHRVEEELQWNKVGRNLLTAYETLLAKK